MGKAKQSKATKRIAGLSQAEIDNIAKEMKARNAPIAFLTQFPQPMLLVADEPGEKG